MSTKQSDCQMTASPVSHELFALLQNEIKAIRELITCKICYNPLYEPYTTSCGHTFCYSCLSKTFDSHRPKNCPECRTTLKLAPAPAFTLREITHRLVKRAELLPDDETVEEHADMRSEQENMVKKERESDIGLFHGSFDSSPKLCPYCDGHIIHGLCLYCGHDMDDESAFTESDSEDLNETSDHTDSERNDDFDMDDLDHGFDLQFPEDAYGVMAQIDDDLESIALPQPERAARQYAHSTANELRHWLATGQFDDAASISTTGAVILTRGQSMQPELVPGQVDRLSDLMSDLSETEMDTVMVEEEVDCGSNDDASGQSSDDQSSSADESSSAAAESTDNSALDRRSRIDHRSTTAHDFDGIAERRSLITAAHENTLLDRSRPDHNSSNIALPSSASLRSTLDTSSRRRPRELTPSSSIRQPRQRRRTERVSAIVGSNLVTPQSRSTATQVSSSSSNFSNDSSAGLGSSHSIRTRLGDFNFDAHHAEQDAAHYSTTSHVLQASSDPSTSNRFDGNWRSLSLSTGRMRLDVGSSNIGPTANQVPLMGNNSQTPVGLSHNITPNNAGRALSNQRRRRRRAFPANIGSQTSLGGIARRNAVQRIAIVDAQRRSDILGRDDNTTQQTQSLTIGQELPMPVVTSTSGVVPPHAMVHPYDEQMIGRFRPNIAIAPTHMHPTGPSPSRTPATNPRFGPRADTFSRWSQQQTYADVAFVPHRLARQPFFQSSSLSVSANAVRPNNPNAITNHPAMRGALQLQQVVLSTSASAQGSRVQGNRQPQQVVPEVVNPVRHRTSNLRPPTHPMNRNIMGGASRVSVTPSDGSDFYNVPRLNASTAFRIPQRTLSTRGNTNEDQTMRRQINRANTRTFSDGPISSNLTATDSLSTAVDSGISPNPRRTRTRARLSRNSSLASFVPASALHSNAQARSVSNPTSVTTVPGTRPNFRSYANQSAAPRA